MQYGQRKLWRLMSQPKQQQPQNKMIRSTDIEDTYKSGAFLRRWSVADSGQAQCAQDAHATADVEQDTLDATTASNAKIRVALAEVDAVESASRITEPDQRSECRNKSICNCSLNGSADGDAAKN